MKVKDMHKDDRLSSGYFYVVICSVTAFLSSYLYILNLINSGQNYIISKNTGGGYVFSLCVFGLAFIVSMCLLNFVPKRLTEYVFLKKIPIYGNVMILAISFLAFVAVMLNYLLLTEIENPPFAIGYTTIFYWRSFPLILVITYTAACVGFIFLYSWKNNDFQNSVVWFVYAITIILTFMHNLYLNNYDYHLEGICDRVYHHAAVYDSVYNCYHGVPYDRFTTGIYGHYGIFIGLLLKLMHGNATTMFFIHAAVAALEACLYIYIIHNCVEKNFIRIISALASLTVMAVLSEYVHWQSVPIRNLALLQIIAYTVWMCRHKKSANYFVIIGYIITAFGIVWNTESGLFSAIAFSAAIIVLNLQKYQWYEKKMLWIYVLVSVSCVLSLMAALIFVNVYNLICGGKLIFKAFFYPYFDSAYMESWGNSSINMTTGNQVWIYTLVGFAMLLLLGVYYTKIVNPMVRKLNLLAPIYTVIAMSGLTMFSYYASRPVYLSLNIVFYFACAAMAIFSDKFVSNLSDIIHKKYSFVEISCRSLGIISMAILTILSSQIVLTTPNLLNKAQWNVWDQNEFNLKSEMVRKVIPKEAMFIGTDTAVFKLQLNWSSQYYYRHCDMMESGTEYCERLVENARKYDYVAFSIISSTDIAALEMFVSLAPEYECISVNYIGEVEIRLYSKLKSYSCNFLVYSLPVNGEYENNGLEILIKPGSIQYGLYTDLKPGRYGIKIEGDGLSDVKNDAICDAILNVPVEEVSRSNTEICYLFNLENAANVEFRTMNNSEHEAVLKNIQLSACG